MKTKRLLCGRPFPPVLLLDCVVVLLSGSARRQRRGHHAVVSRRRLVFFGTDAALSTVSTKRKLSLAKKSHCNTVLYKIVGLNAKTNWRQPTLHFRFAPARTASMAAMEDVRYGSYGGAVFGTPALGSTPVNGRPKKGRPNNGGTPEEGGGDGGFEGYFSRGNNRGGEAYSPSGSNVHSVEGLRAQLTACQVSQDTTHGSRGRQHTTRALPPNTALHLQRKNKNIGGGGPRNVNFPLLLDETIFALG
jgi:hypothetical protein